MPTNNKNTPEQQENTLGLFANLVSAYAQRAKDIIELAGLEAKLAVRTFIIICILGIIACVLVLSTWILMLVTAFTYLLSLNLSALASASILTACNILLILICFIYVLIIRKNLFFNATRKEITKSRVKS